MESTKPPIGLKPKFVNRIERIQEIKEVTVRYLNANRELPIEWVEEYNELIELTSKK